jgi:hypothetical protein
VNLFAAAPRYIGLLFRDAKQRMTILCSVTVCAAFHDAVRIIPSSKAGGSPRERCRNKIPTVFISCAALCLGMKHKSASVCQKEIISLQRASLGVVD